MSHTSIIMNNPCEIINVVPYNPFISRCCIKVCYIGQNRNRTVISKEVAIELAKSLPGSPIVGYYNEATGDFEEHNEIIEIAGGTLRIKDSTKAYGFVDLNARTWFQDYLDDGVPHTYLVTEGYIWTGQFPESKRIIERGNNQSMELDEETLKGTWTIDNNSNVEFFIINEAIISKLCILGEDFEPCFEGARIEKFSLDRDFHQKVYSLMKEVQKLKGGELSFMDETLKNLENEEVQANAAEPETEFAAVEPEAEPAAAEPETPAVEPEVTEPETAESEDVEPENSQDESVKFSLEDFQTLQENYSTLENSFNELQEKFNVMEANYNLLVAFKEQKDREAKQAMIDSFYMLSDDEKKDVQDNIDTYSLDEIEGKLSIICVHNKLDLSEKSEEENNHSETTFSLDDANFSEEEENVPAWLSLLRKTKKNEK